MHISNVCALQLDKCPVTVSFTTAGSLIDSVVTCQLHIVIPYCVSVVHSVMLLLSVSLTHHPLLALTCVIFSSPTALASVSHLSSATDLHPGEIEVIAVKLSF